MPPSRSSSQVAWAALDHTAALPKDAVLEVRHVVVPAEPGLFQLDSLKENVEQPTIASEQERRPRGS
jgi:hypothetical protein